MRVTSHMGLVGTELGDAAIKCGRARDTEGRLSGESGGKQEQMRSGRRTLPVITRTPTLILRWELSDGSEKHSEMI